MVLAPFEKEWHIYVLLHMWALIQTVLPQKTKEEVRSLQNFSVKVMLFLILF